MKDMKPRERWDVWMVQAQRFAARENYIDALGRVRLVVREVEEALTDARDTERARLQRFLHRVCRREERIRTQFEAWNAKIAARRQAAIADAADEMKRPLPYGPDEQI